MSFLDELVHNSDLTAVVVDRRAQPGGHWTDAYDFVRLHQPAAFYGVNSRPLGAGGPDLASKVQILAYYELVMKDLIATGRVTWLPLTDYRGNGHLVSLVQEGLEYQINITRKTVDATALLTKVPSTHPPNYRVEEGVQLLPINGLARISKPWKKYVVIGAGKTGIDAILYLLDLQVDQDNIIWIVSNDCWYYSRDALARGGFEGPEAIKCVLASNTLKDLYNNFEEGGHLIRISKDFEPSKMRAATISEAEIKRIRQLKNIVREGRIESISQSEITFKNGFQMSTDLTTLHVDCSANGTIFAPPKQIFTSSTITLQMVKLPAVTASASVIAGLELLWPKDEEKKNNVADVVSAPHDLEDWFVNFKIHLQNKKKIMQALGFQWLWNRRLGGVNISEIAGVKIGLLVGAIKLLGLSERGQNQMIERLETIFEAEQITK